MTSWPLLHNPEPIFKLAGEPCGALTRDAVWLEVEESTAGLRTLKLHLVAQGRQQGKVDQDLLYMDGTVLDFGTELEVTLGAGDEARTVFKGQVSALELSLRDAEEPQLAVFAEDALMRLRQARACTTHVNRTDAGIAEDIARRHGLGADAQAEGPRYDVVQQWDQSDLAFLRQRARLLQAELWVRDGVLHFKTRDKRQCSQLTLTAGNELVEVQLRADVAHQRTGAVVSGYEAKRREAIDKAAAPTVVRDEAPVGRLGPEVLGQVARDWTLKELPTLRVREAPLADAEAEAWARAELLRRARAFVVATGTTQGSPELDVGSRLTLERVGRPFIGPGYYVTHVRHSWSRSGDGFRTHFTAERPTLGEAR